jgi:hypothetical protein
MEIVVSNPYLFREIARYLEIFELEALSEIGDDVRQTLISPVFDEFKLEALTRWIRKVTNWHFSFILDLRGWNKLTRLPESIGILSNLNVLYLDNNELTLLPESIGQLVNLRRLWLNHNNLMSLPESIGRLRALKELWVHCNQLTSLPDAIGRLKNLRALRFRGNRLISLPESIMDRLIICDDPELLEQQP